MIWVAVVRTALFALLWLLLAGPDPASWLLGAPAVALASWLSIRLQPGRALRLLPLLAFSVAFLGRSCLGAVDVALRALSPTPRLAPALIAYRTRLPRGLPQVVFVNSISLTPGTLGADLQGSTVWVHVLDDGQRHEDALEKLEDNVARIFAL